jgi:hypothetical protein
MGVYLSDGIHMTTLCPRKYRNHATEIEAFTVRKYVGILRRVFEDGVLLCQPQIATA